MSGFRTLDDVAVAGLRVLVRVDLNVPIQDGEAADLIRIERVAPTILELSDKGARVILLAHLGRPKGERNPEMSLKPVARAVQKVVGRPVAFASDCVGDAAEKEAAKLGNGDILLLENTRFHAGEEKNDPKLAKEMAALGDLFVNDAFSCSHRAHVSTEGLSKHLEAVAGRCMQAELEALERALSNPERPAAALVGGAKVSTKLDVLDNLTGKVDMLIIGGAMANTFLLAMGKQIGKSLAEPDLVATAQRIMTTAKSNGCEIVLPVDAVVASALEADVETETVDIDSMPEDRMILDVGRRSIAEVIARLGECRTLMWNGPMGAFEVPPFDKATVEIARAAAELTKKGTLLSVAGGGDTGRALNHAGVTDGFSYVSTAGGAFLEWIEGKTLPGVAALQD
ncbi:MAG: phosphoglycerate kinase [Minwuia sp.]|uniref:phosphoglycerate kinase n=1 Tax=Minwuia sp. TaxID=2493630 RepID=UPI003A847390